MAKAAGRPSSHSRKPNREIADCAEKLAFFYRGRTGPNDSPVRCKHIFWFQSAKDMAEALGLGEAQLKGAKRDDLSDEALDALAVGLGFDARSTQFTQGTAVEFAKWYNENNHYDGRFATRGQAAAADDQPVLRCERAAGQRPTSKNARLVTVELRSERNETTLPWPLNLGLTLGSHEANEGTFFIRAARLVFDFGDSQAQADLPGDRGSFPGTLNVTPEKAPIKLTPDGHSYRPEWIIEATAKSRPAGPLTIRNLIAIHQLSGGETVTAQLWIPAKDLERIEDGPGSPPYPQTHRTQAFALKTSGKQVAPRDAKAALLEHVRRIELLRSDSGEACLAMDSLNFVGEVVGDDEASE